MNENEKKFFYLVESMRDGCTLDIIYESIAKKDADDIMSNFIEKNYIFENDGIISVNYEKIEINCWSDVKIK